MKEIVIAFSIASGLTVLITGISFFVVLSFTEKYNTHFDAACSARGGVPHQLAIERICVAPGVMK